MQRLQTLLPILMLGVMTGCTWLANVGVAPIPGESVVLGKTYDQSPTVIEFDYPEDWIVQIPESGTLVIAPESTLRGAIGPSLLIRRSTLLAGLDSVDEALETFLENGPFRRGRNWEIVAEKAPLQVSNRDAIGMKISGSELPDAPTLHVWIVATRTDETIPYFLAFTVPEEDWATMKPTFEAVLDSLKLYR